MTRGVPGTHDVELAQATLDSLAEDEPTLLPVFDKATDDRRPRAQWRAAQGPLRVVILEGWCVGALPQDSVQLAQPVNALERDEDPDARWRTYVNEALTGRYRALFDRLSPLVLLAAPSFEVVQRWRGEQEQRLREKLALEGGDASRVMDAAAIARFIAHYERVTRHILDEMPQRADHVISLDEWRTARFRR
jgi:D-glycerate 3-kinase